LAPEAPLTADGLLPAAGGALVTPDTALPEAPVAPPSLPEPEVAAEPAAAPGSASITPAPAGDIVAPAVDLYHEGPVTALPGLSLEPSTPVTVTPALAAPDVAPATPVAHPASVGRMPTAADATRLRSARVEWNGKTLAVAARPELADGVLMVSLKHYFDAAEGAVYWFPEDKLARAVSAAADLTLRMGKNRAMLNGQARDLSRPPVVREGRVMVPLAVVVEALALRLDYDTTSNVLHIAH
jgi:hypothetical protein